MPSLTTRRVRVRGHLALLSSCAMVAFGLGIAAVSAQTNGPEVFVADPETSGIRSAAPAEMVAQARERGGIRVIVGFDLEMGLEGEMSSAEVGRQRGEISTGQERILGGLSSPGNVTRYDAIPYMALELSADDLEALFRMPGITSVRETFGAQIDLNNSVPHISANRIWPRTEFGAGQYVAVLDTGLAYNHVAFEDGFDYSACYNTTNILAGTETLCPNGEDVHLGPRSARDCGSRADDPIAGCGHGTHVAGTAVGERPNRRGVAPAAKVIPMNVFSSAGDSITAFNEDLISALQRVLNLKANRDIPIAAANMSLGIQGLPFEGTCDDYDPAVTAIVDQLRSHGVATISSSGNDGFDGAIGWPSCISSMITVGNSVSPGWGTEDDVWETSNHATSVDLMAPGHVISAPDIHGGPGYVGLKGGTSMAAPHVAGAWALLKSAYPEASIDEVHRALACSGAENGALPSREGVMRPRINVAAARNFLNETPSRLRERDWDFLHPAQVNNQWDTMGDWSHAGARMVGEANEDPAQGVAMSPFCTSQSVAHARMRFEEPDGQESRNGILLSKYDDGESISGLWFAVTAHYDGSDDDGGLAGIWALNGVSRDDWNDGNWTNLCNTTSMDIDTGNWHRISAMNSNGRLALILDGEIACNVDLDDPEVIGALDHSTGFGGVAFSYHPGEDGRSMEVSRFIIREMGVAGTTRADVADELGVDLFASDPVGTVAPGSDSVSPVPAGAEVGMRVD